jgi:hypothetical protein
MLASILGWLSNLVFRRVRLQHRVTASLCTYGHPIIFYLGDPVSRGPLHVDITMELWVPEHRTTVRDIEAQAAGQLLDRYVTFTFTAMTLEPGTKPEKQTVALAPREGEALRAKVGDRLKLKLLLTRGRPRQLKVPIVAESA